MDFALLNLVIVTRNRPHSLRRLLQSIPLGQLGKIHLIVVDDSTVPTIAKKNLTNLISFAPSSVEYLHREQAESLTAHYFLRSRKEITNDQWRPWTLGWDGWNAGAARNVGMLAAVPCATSTIFLDDDVLLKSDTSKLVPRLKSEVVFGKLAGCPDYDLITWIKWMFAAVSAKFRERCVQSGYWVEPRNNLELLHHEVLLHRYTNFGVLTGRSQVTYDFSIEDIPAWIGKSGTAFSTNLPIEKCPIFPTFHGEDLYWMRRTAAEGGASRVAESVIFHDRSKKNLLSVRALLREEFGALCARSLYIARADPNRGTRQVLMQLARARSRNIHSLAKHLELVGGSDRNELVKLCVQKLLFSLADHLIRSEIIEQHHKALSSFGLFERAWEVTRKSVRERSSNAPRFLVKDCGMTS